MKDILTEQWWEKHFNTLVLRKLGQVFVAVILMALVGAFITYLGLYMFEPYYHQTIFVPLLGFGIIALCVWADLQWRAKNHKTKSKQQEE